MTLYVDSSAWLAILFGVPTAGAVRAALEGARTLVTSELALVEISRSLRRVDLNPELAVRHVRQVSAIMPVDSEGEGVSRPSP